MSIVYVVQNQLQYDKIQDKLVPKFDFSSAMEYGELIFLLSPTAAPFKNQTIINELHSKLRFLTQDDYILLVGNPILLGLTAIVASEYCDDLKFLQWSGKKAKYIPVDIHL